MTEHNQKDAFSRSQTGDQQSGGVTGSVRNATGEAIDSATTRVKESANAVADQAKQTLNEATRQTKSELSSVTTQVRRQADSLVSEQKGLAADRLGTLAGALRQTSHQLQEQEDGTMGHYTEVIADQVDMVSNFLRERNPGDLLGDLQRIARQQPELFVAGSLAVGFLIGRFIKGPSRAALGQPPGSETYYGPGNYRGGAYQAGGFQGASYQGRYESSGFQGNAYRQGGQESIGYQAEGADSDGIVSHGATDFREDYQGGNSAYETGPTITEGSDTDYPRYDPTFGGSKSGDVETNYTPSSRR